MKLLFKFIGLILIITVCASAGFLKANKLKLRAEKLASLQKGVIRLKELIRLGCGEIDQLVAQSFKEYPLDYSYLEMADCEITEGLIKEIGILDSISAYNRCEICITLLDNLKVEAEQNYHELGKLYKSIGALSGIFICILLI